MNKGVILRGNTFGKLFSLSTFGESHGEAMGVVIDGMPPGVEISLENLQKALDLRAPGKTPGLSSRKELDRAQILSGVFEGKTLGTPIAVVVKNENQRASDYRQLKNEFRPGHADKTTLLKYGLRDHRGGGRASGRETVARVIAGYFAQLIVKKTSVNAYVNQLGPFELKEKFLTAPIDKGPYQFPDSGKWDEITAFLQKAKERGESYGGKVSVVITDCPVGLGEPVFNKLKADLGKAILSIGACVGVNFGLGEKFCEMKGSEVTSDRSHFGGIEGGISNGDPIFFEAYFRAPSTVGENAKKGRHDPCILPRVVPVIEAMALMVLADHYLRQKAYQKWM